MDGALHDQPVGDAAQEAGAKLVVHGEGDVGTRLASYRAGLTSLAELVADACPDERTRRLLDDARGVLASEGA
jgi:hypothetical protein